LASRKSYPPKGVLEKIKRGGATGRNTRNQVPQTKKKTTPSQGFPEGRKGEATKDNAKRTDGITSGERPRNSKGDD